ncbi:hypothetical protein HanRHA438_Chr04g0171151 [Helianthus annuus]|nr:hypothetical protein HanRHA438_Chr04g0171151 [Helianthus annuus]
MAYNITRLTPAQCATSSKTILFTLKYNILYKRIHWKKKTKNYSNARKIFLVDYICCFTRYIPIFV